MLLPLIKARELTLYRPCGLLELFMFLMGLPVSRTALPVDKGFSVAGIPSVLVRPVGPVEKGLDELCYFLLAFVLLFFVQHNLTF